jgi:paraquat-inducible protein B
VVSGGLAYEVRDPVAATTPAPANATFPLYDDRAHAMMRPDAARIATTMRFPGSMRGVGVGAVVDFQGVTIGYVDALRPGYRQADRSFYTDVDATVFPERLGAAYTGLIAEGKASGKTGLDMLRVLTDRGLRAQIRSGNLITGQGYIALAWDPHDKPGTTVTVGETWAIPTVPGGVDHMQEQVQEIVAKLDAMPFDQIGKEAQATIAQLHKSATAMHDNFVAPDSSLQQSMKTTLEQVQRAAFSLRGLADYLQQHPESLLRGKGGK